MAAFRSGNTHRQNNRKCILVGCFLLLLLVTPSLQCGPGMRSARRNPRKRTPLVFKQHLPNLSENNLGASGPNDKPIYRNDSRKILQRNTNPDIIFRDEEGNGDDRIMTQRCKDKVNTLAIAVMNQWRNVKLRITEAWDERGERGALGQHAADSLHYEGRAVDITTSDRDKSKYGMLARLANEAGFDWVYYESRGHIHCSVKSDSSIASKSGGCFSGQMKVTTIRGTSEPISSIQIGDEVLTINAEGQLAFDKVIAFFHQDQHESTFYLTLYAENGKHVTMTPNHLIYASPSNKTNLQNAQPIFARDVQVGDFIYVREGQEFILSKVLRVTETLQRGLYAPLTKHGTIVVNDVITSCYAVIYSHDIAHASLAPLRWAHKLLDFSYSLTHNSDPKPEVQKGIHWYAQFLHGLAQLILPSSFLYIH